MGSASSELSIVSVTSARPSGARDGRAREDDVLHLAAAQRLGALLAQHPGRWRRRRWTCPSRSGPTTQVMPGSKRRVVGEAKDLKPFSVRLLRCTGNGLRGSRSRERTGRSPAGSLTGPVRSGLDEAGKAAARRLPALDDALHPAGRGVAAERVEQLLAGTVDYPLQSRRPGGPAGCAPRPRGRARARDTESTSGNPLLGRDRGPTPSVEPSFRPCATVAHRDRLPASWRSPVDGARRRRAAHRCDHRSRRGTSGPHPRTRTRRWRSRSSAAAVPLPISRRPDPRRPDACRAGPRPPRGTGQERWDRSSRSSAAPTPSGPGRAAGPAGRRQADRRRAGTQRGHGQPALLRPPSPDGDTPQTAAPRRATPTTAGRTSPMVRTRPPRWWTTG